MTVQVFVISLIVYFIIVITTLARRIHRHSKSAQIDEICELPKVSPGRLGSFEQENKVLGAFSLMCPWRAYMRQGGNKVFGIWSVADTRTSADPCKLRLGSNLS